MPIDGLAFEPQFVDHAAPVWRALRPAARGEFLTSDRLGPRAAAEGLEARLLDDVAIRRSSAPPRARPGEGPLAFATSIGDIKVGRRLGYRRFVFMEHGCGQAYGGARGGARYHPSYAGGVDRDDVVLFLVPNEYSAKLWRARYPDAAVEIIGSPRLDTLPAREPGDHPVVAVSFHWPAFVAPESGTALGTYQRELPALAKRFAMIGHAHPKGDWPKRMEATYRQAGIEFVPDFADVCRRADVYVCDNSSTLFEFAATGRPVVVLNSPMYRRHVRHGLRFWDAADVGIQVDRAADLAPAIERAILDPPDVAERREAALRIVYAHRTGAAARAAAAIEAIA